ncbi:MAG: arginine--tRNA ligase [Pseudomonadota bacterium]
MLADQLKPLFETSIQTCLKAKLFELDIIPEIIIDKPKRSEHGDLACNIALILASQLKKDPLQIAQAIAHNIPKDNDFIESVNIAKPGFINIVIKPGLYLKQLNEIINQDSKFGLQNLGQGQKVQVEFVSANPTGPLHIGHGRGAVYGDVLANILKEVGYDVTKEYYVNNAGNQIQTLGKSIYLRLLELKGQKIEFPEECYQGNYIIDIAQELLNHSAHKIESLSEVQAIEFCGEYAADKILDEIRLDLEATGVIHDEYFYENHLHTDAAVERALQELKNHNSLEERDGALWFKSTQFGDDKDRVLKKSDGALTYFATDIAYHKNKYDRGFQRIIDVLGADHGGYVARMQAVVQALGHPKDSLNIVLIQLVNLIRAGELISMSTRSATYETLQDVREQVGKDVCRYFFLMRSHTAQLDFDLELAKKETAENPVFYIQYAHARICSVFAKTKEKGISPDFNQVDLTQLNLPEEVNLARMLGEYPSVLSRCALTLEPHHLTFYLLELAKCFQGYYSKAKEDERYIILTQNKNITNSKLFLLKSCQIVLQNALRVLGISAPEQMKRENESHV